jgi:uroporphyrinogen-III synthase
MSPLSGSRVAVTRPDTQADALCASLDSLGAVPVRCPTIRIGPPASYDALDAALGRLETYDWVVFTSANGVRATLDRFEEIGTSRSILRTMRVAAVGRVTSAALAERGVEVAFVPDVEGSHPLGETLSDVQGRSVLLALGDKADPILAKGLRARAARRVDTVTAYRTIPTPPSGSGLEELRIGVDAITFTSPSTVAGFVSLGPEWHTLLRRAVVATIGPTTTAAALSSGVGVHAEARDRSMPALIEAVADALRKGARTGR